MIRLAVDENFDNDIVRGILRRKPDIDIVRIQDAGLRGKDDPSILEWAAQEGRVLFTNDVHTMTDFAYERVRNGLPMPGVFEVSRDVPIGQVIEDMILVAEGSIAGEWEGQVLYLPLR